MKEILCDSQIFLKLKAVDSYCYNSDIGLIILNETFVFSEEITNRIKNNKWNENNNYQLILRGDFTRNKIISLINLGSQYLIQRVWIPSNWDKKFKDTVINYCSSLNIQLKELN